MASKPVEIGAMGRHAAETIARLRRERGWEQRDLAERVATAGRGLSASVLSKIENGSRRIDVDDLVAVAAALEVSPALLILAAPARPREPGGDTLPGPVRSVSEAVGADIEALGDLVDIQPSLAQMALKLARQIDEITVRTCVCGEEIPGRDDATKLLPQLTRELRVTLGELLEARVPEEDDDDLGDLADPE